MARVGVIALSFVLFLVANSWEVFATKPCQLPCRQNGVFNAQECRKLADWVAVGTISNIQHHPEGSPLSKNFASFDFNVEGFEEGGDPSRKVYHFQVGWCRSPTELPANTGGRFRFYGAKKAGSENGGEQYLDFERVEEN